MSAVWESALPHDEKFVALALADWAGDDGGSLYPSQQHIAWKLGKSLRGVRDTLDKLIDRGVLEVISVGRAGAGASHYRFIAAGLPERPPFRQAADSAGSKRQNLPVASGKNFPLQAADSAADPLSDPSDQPPVETHTPPLMLLAAGEYPSQPPGPNSRAVAGTVKRLEGEQAVARALFELRAAVAVEAAPPHSVQANIATWVQYLSVEDVAEVKRRAQQQQRGESRDGGWGFIRAVCSRAAGVRRDGGDPWAAPAPARAADAGVGRGGAARERPDAREGGRGRVGASGSRGDGRDRQGLPLPDLEAFVAAQKSRGRDSGVGAPSSGTDGGAGG